MTLFLLLLDNMKTYIKEHIRDAACVCAVFLSFCGFLLILSSLTGCHSRTHTSRHYNEAGTMVHVDRTRSYSLFGKSESAALNGTYDYWSELNDKTNLTHRVTFGVTGEKKAVDSEGLKAGGGALGEVIGTAGEKILKP